MNKNIKYSQNFLTSEKVLNQIIKQLNLKETDTVYEIGTGKGHLTTKLAKISKQVTSIELDSHLFNLSSEKLKLNTRVTLIHQDILQFQFPNKQRYKIVGNIPYHLSTQIIKKVVFESHASDIYLIVEEGFYKRTLDIHRTLGLLLHTQVSIQQLLKLPAECFHPKPRVNSVLIKLTRHTTDVPDKYWKLYTYFVSKGTVAKLAMRQPFVLFKGLTFQKLCLPGAFRPGDHHNKMLRPGLCVVHASPQYL
ncbi:23S ribosomal RNA methyltransferase Erm [Shigella flexneri]|nr:23S ribosomal RNA methyltransferase Erm [Shigella flexneri]